MIANLRGLSLYKLIKLINIISIIIIIYLLGTSVILPLLRTYNFEGLIVLILR